MNEKQIPTGKLIIIGGNETKEPEKKLTEDSNQNVDFNEGVLNEVIGEMKISPVIEVIPAASENQEEMGKKYIAAFSRLKQKAKVMTLSNKKDANSPENLQRIEEANIVFLTGGDQSKLFDIIGNTQLHKVLKNKYENEDFIIAGSSSGAMVMSQNMITAGESNEALLKGLIDLKEGLGLIANVIIDTHFLSRGRISRLAESLLIYKNNIGLGICEDTGVVVTEGRYLRTIGSGTVVIMEGRNIKNTNYLSLKENDPVYIENITMHILSKGAGYDLMERKFIVSKKPENKKQMQST
ncbi:MAG TPA: cyanophycinase [Bacteroidales bacterium]|nr:cyanophycinase [Bacteroidales bacterium]